MRRNAVVAVLSAVVISGCYHVTVVTGAPPSPTVIDKPWQLSFVAGLIPPPTMNMKAECPKGLAKVETEQSFLDMLVGGISSNLVTPVHATVTCASGPIQK